MRTGLIFCGPNWGLRKAGKNVRLVRLAGEDHYLNLAETRIRMLTGLEAFLAANIGSPR